jgi:hypothetical protein
VNENVTYLNTKIDRLETQLKAELSATANAHLELGKKIETKLEQWQASAGRDVNMLPQAAVDVMITTAQLFAGIITTLCGVAATTISVMARNSRKRAEQRALIEREEKKQLFDLLRQFGGGGRAVLVDGAHDETDSRGQIRDVRSDCWVRFGNFQAKPRLGRGRHEGLRADSGGDLRNRRIHRHLLLCVGKGQAEEEDGEMARFHVKTR